VGNSPEGHEMHLRMWAKKLPGVTFLSVDYNLSPEARFPFALQQVLDVYLWATSGFLDVEPILGVKPRKVILCGDSAGGNLVTSLCLVLNDIRKTGQEPSLLMPKAVFSIYPYYSVNLDVSPSYLMTPFCFIISPFTVNTIIETYLPKHEFSDCNSKPWFHQNPSKKEAIVKHLNKYRTNPYIIPLCYQGFETLEDVGLHLFHPMYCPFLDQSVELAKKWKGTVSLDVTDNSGHGCIQYGVFDERVIDSFYNIIDRFKSVFESES
jgi:acetyl esterase/lipase